MRGFWFIHEEVSTGKGRKSEWKESPTCVDVSIFFSNDIFWFKEKTRHNSFSLSLFFSYFLLKKSREKEGEKCRIFPQSKDSTSVSNRGRVCILIMDGGMIFIRKLNELYEKEVAGRKKRKNQERKRRKWERKEKKESFRIEIDPSINLIKFDVIPLSFCSSLSLSLSFLSLSLIPLSFPITTYVKLPSFPHCSFPTPCLIFP